MEIKINGIYSIETIQFLQDLKIKNFGFDLRPTSFNFIQLHSIREIISKVDTGKEVYSFIFENEKDYVIQELLKNIKEETLIDPNRILIEFASITDISVCENFKMNYNWHFSNQINYRKIQDSNYLKILSFSQRELIELQNKEEFFHLIKEINEIKNDSNILDLRVDWTESLIESIIDFINPQILTFEVNNLVETSYRNTNNQLIQNHLYQIAKQLDLRVAQ